MTLDEHLCPEDPPVDPLENLSPKDFNVLLGRWYNQLGTDQAWPIYVELQQLAHKDTEEAHRD